MKRGKFDTLVPTSRLKLIKILAGLLFLYLIFMSFEIPHVLRTGLGSLPGDGFNGFIGDAFSQQFILESEQETAERDAPSRPSFRVSKGFSQSPQFRAPDRRMREYKKVSGLAFHEGLISSEDGFSEIHKSAKQAWEVGKTLWSKLESGNFTFESKKKVDNQSESCPHSIALSGSEFQERNKIMVLPCGLTLGSHITVVGKPHWAHAEYDPKIVLLREEDQSVMVSQFMMELQGLKTVDGEDPPRILHFNPRLKGDWSGKPMIEQNTCYRMQWGTALRCEGWKSRADEETGI